VKTAGEAKRAKIVKNRLFLGGHFIEAWTCPCFNDVGFAMHASNTQRLLRFRAPRALERFGDFYLFFVITLLMGGPKGFGDSGGVDEREALEVLGMALRCWCGVLGLELRGSENWEVLIGLGSIGRIEEVWGVGANWCGVGSEWVRCWSWMWS
jgi:hypothetical protein